MQDSMLSTLPKDVLYHLCRILMKDSMRAEGADALTQAEQERSASHASIVIQAYRALRSCCKSLRDACDDSRTSMYFRAEDQHHVEPYLQKLPNLNAVSISYGSNTRYIRSSLVSLHSIVPRLASLTLDHETDFHDTDPLTYVRAGVGTSDAILRWSASLQSLQLRRFNFLAQNGDTGLAFLSQLTSLTAYIEPRVPTADGQGACWMHWIGQALRAWNLPVYGQHIHQPGCVVPEISSTATLHKLQPLPPQHLRTDSSADLALWVEPACRA